MLCSLKPGSSNTSWDTMAPPTEYICSAYGSYRQYSSLLLLRGVFSR